MENITITDVTVVINNWICLTGFEGPLRGGEKKVERVGREGNVRKKRDGRYGREHPLPE